MKNLNRFLIEIFASFTFLCLAFPSLATGAPFAYITNRVAIPYLSSTRLRILW